ncbi:hypothetical protein KIPB_011760, partial [Kipferlia bialata]|eukprot:g11760.t1
MSSAIAVPEGAVMRQPQQSKKRNSVDNKGVDTNPMDSASSALSDANPMTLDTPSAPAPPSLSLPANQPHLSLFDLKPQDLVADSAVVAVTLIEWMCVGFSSFSSPNEYTLSILRASEYVKAMVGPAPWVTGDKETSDKETSDKGLDHPYLPGILNRVHK